MSYIHSFNHAGNDLTFNFAPERQQMFVPNPIQIGSNYSSPRNNQVVSGKLNNADTRSSLYSVSNPWRSNDIPEHPTKNPFNPAKSGQISPPGIPSFNSPAQPAVNIGAPSSKISSRPVNPTTPSGESSTRPASKPGDKPSTSPTSNPVDKSASQSISSPSNPVGNPGGSGGPTENPSGGSATGIPSKQTDSEKEKSKKPGDTSSSKPKEEDSSKKDKSPEKQEKAEAVQSAVVAQTCLKALLEQSKVEEEETASKPIPASVIGQAFLKTLSGQSYETQESVPSQTLPSSVVGQVFLKSLIELSEVPKAEAPKPVPASVVGQAFLKTLLQESEVEQTEKASSQEQAHKETHPPVPSTVVGQAFLKTLLQQSQTKEEEESSKVIPSSVVGQTFLKTLLGQQAPLSEEEPAPHAIPASVVGQSFLKTLLEHSETSETQESQKPQSIPAPVVGQAFLKTLLQESEKIPSAPESKTPSVIPASVVGQAFLKTLVQQEEPVQKPGEHIVPSAVVGQVFLKTLFGQSGASKDPGAKQKQPESEPHQPVPSSVVGHAFLKTLLEQSELAGDTVAKSDSGSQLPTGAHGTPPAIPASVVGQAFLKTLVQQSEATAPEHSHEEGEAHPPVPASVVGQAFLKSLVEQSELLKPESKVQEEPPPIPSSVVGQAFLKTLLQKSEPLVQESEVSKGSESKEPVPASVVGQAFLKTLIKESEGMKSESKAQESHPVPASVVGQAFLKTLLQESEPVAQESGAKQPIPAPVVGQAFLKSLLQQAEPSSTAPSTQESEGQSPVPSSVVGQVFLKTLLQQSESPSTSESKPSVKGETSQPIPAPVVGQAFLKMLMQSEEQSAETSTTEASHDSSPQAVPASVVGQAFLKTLLQQSEPAVEESQPDVKPQASAAQHSVPASVIGQTFLKTLLQQSESTEVQDAPAGKESKHGEGGGSVPASVIGQAFLKTLIQQSGTTASTKSPEPDTSAVQQTQKEAHSSKPIPASVIEQSFLKTLSEQVQSQPEQEPVIPASVIGQSFLKTLLQQPEQEVGESASVIPASVVGQAFLQTLVWQISQGSESTESPCSSDKGCGETSPDKGCGETSPDKCSSDKGCDESSPGKCSSGSGCGETHHASSSQEVSDCPHSSGNVCSNEECISSSVLNVSFDDEVCDMSVKEELCMMKNICEKIISGFYRFHSDNSRIVASPPQNENVDLEMSEKCNEKYLPSDESYRRNSYDVPPEITAVSLEQESVDHNALEQKELDTKENSSSNDDVTCLDLKNESRVELVETGDKQICQNVDVPLRGSKKSDKQGAPRTSAEIRGMIFDVWKITEELQDIVGNLDNSFGLNVQNEGLESCNGLTTESQEPGLSSVEETVCSLYVIDVCAESNEKNNCGMPLNADENVTSTDEESQLKAISEISNSLGFSENEQNIQLNGFNGGGSDEDHVSQLEDAEQVENSAASISSYDLPCEVNQEIDETMSLDNVSDLHKAETQVCINGNNDVSSVTKYLNDLRMLCSEGKVLLNQLSLQLQKESLAKTTITSGGLELEGISCTELRIASPVSEDINNVRGADELGSQESEDAILPNQPSPSEVSALSAQETLGTGETNLSSSDIDLKQISMEDMVSDMEENSSLNVVCSECIANQSAENNSPSTEQPNAFKEENTCLAQSEPQEHERQWNGNNGNQDDVLFSAIFLPPPEFRNTPSDNENIFSCCSSDPKCIKMEAMLAKHSLGSINELLSFTDLMQRIIETMADPV